MLINSAKVLQFSKCLQILLITGFSTRLNKQSVLWLRFCFIFEGVLSNMSK